MEWLDQQDIETLDIKTRCALFVALKHHVYFSADQNQYIQTATYEHPEFGSFTKPSIDESQYKWEIGLMHNLTAGMAYTPHMQDVIAAITQKQMDDMLAIEDFNDDITRWPLVPLENRRIAAWGYCYVFTDLCRKATRLDIENTPFYPLDETVKNMPYFAAFSPTVAEMKNDAELHIVISIKNRTCYALA